MLLRYPDYYENFSCIAQDCEDTCCAGWEIDIDEKSYAYYQSLDGEYGELVRSRIRRYCDEEGGYEVHGFALGGDKRCPFLNEDNLCDMILHLGEEALCDVCTDTPRNFLEYGNAREISISPSCAEAGRLIFGSDKRVVFVEKQTDETLDFEESSEELAYAEAVLQAKNRAIAILQERKYSIEDRLFAFLQFAAKVQDLLNQNQIESICCLAKEWQPSGQNFAKTDGRTEKEDSDWGGQTEYDFFRQRMDTLAGLESLNGEWQTFLNAMQECFLHEGGKKRYLEAVNGLKGFLESQRRMYEYEQLVVYYAFLLLARCVDDGNFWGKAQFVAVNFLLVRDMDALRFWQNGGSYSVEDRVDVARIFAKEVEHSEENLAYLEEEFLFEDSYRLEELCRQLKGEKTDKENGR